MLRLIERVATEDVESWSSSVKLKFPAVVGVPLKVMVEGVNKSPAGTVEPAAMAHVYGGVPPDGVTGMRWL